jgi:subtilisin
MAGATRKSVIVTFKPKDQRPDRTRDKVDILRTAITSQENVTFFNAVTLPHGAALPADPPRARIGYDVNQYEAPMVKPRHDLLAISVHLSWPYSIALGLTSNGAA